MLRNTAWSLVKDIYSFDTVQYTVYIMWVPIKIVELNTLFKESKTPVD